ncbi:MAG: hypothetical protein ACXWWV_10605 [Candidatus Deferrimicrobiaceae bacterium]
MRRPVLATIALSLLALLFGWKTRQALQATPGKQDNSAMVPAGSWQPAVPAPDPQPPPDPGPTASAVTARPLFRPDRQPFREQVGSPIPVRNYEAELSRFSLLGVHSFGDELKGLVLSRSGARTDRWELKAGESFPGFTVKEVRMDSLLVTADDREFQLPLYAGAPTGTGGALRTDVPKAASTPATAPVTTAPAQAAPRAGQGVAATAPPAPVSPRDIRPRYIPGRR